MTEQPYLVEQVERGNVGGVSYADKARSPLASDAVLIGLISLPGCGGCWSCRCGASRTGFRFRGWALKVTWPTIAATMRGSAKMVPHSLNGRLVPIAIDARSSRSGRLGPAYKYAAGAPKSRARSARRRPSCSGQP